MSNPQNPYGYGYESEVPEVDPMGNRILPLPETVQGVNFPYRGGEQHGVAAEYAVEISPDQWEGGFVNVADPEEGPTPVPVRIVAEGPHEIKSWNATQVSVDGVPRELVGANNFRTSLQIRNLSDTVVVYIGRANGANTLSGWPIDPGAIITLTSTREVHGVSTGALVPIAILQEFAVGE